MAITNYDRVTKAMDLLRQGLYPFVERELQAHHGKYWITNVTEHWRNELTWTDDDTPHLDIAALLRIMWDEWNTVFRTTLGCAERTYVSELRDYRNKWAHQKPFSSRDAQRVLDTAARLLKSISAPETDELEHMYKELSRHIFDEQVRSEQRKSNGKAVESSVTGNLKPWREVITPHKDVASGTYQQAEFAADLWQVHLGGGSNEYRDPIQFFRRTYLTESLKSLLVGAIQRMQGLGGDPVIQLQTNFGGGKTHSMLALYHLFSGVSPTDMPGIEGLMQAAHTTTLPTARRVVLVGNKISPGNPSIKPDGTNVRTFWGELAWQLGGADAYYRIHLDDQSATSPGDMLRTLFDDYGPCIILIDEWVAYARQLHDQSDLPAGSFDTQFSFAQALTESARLSKQCLLVISLPASEDGSKMHAQADDIEVGGVRGREALSRLQNVIGRIESSWRPASAEESFEIVRRRLFEPLTDPQCFKDRDVVARAFADTYRTQQQEFPAECQGSDYEQRIKAAYPIHPEIFDRLYNDWSTLVKFQRTRGVLRLMSVVIHSLWEKGDRNPLIMPGNIPIDDVRVQSELTRYLSDNWVPILEKDVDGPGSLPMQIDAEMPNLGKYAACRRIARTIYLGSAPIVAAPNRGLNDRRVKLGCVMPGESPPIFGDAMRRLASVATYLYQDGPRYWYATQPTVTKLAEERAESLKRETDKVEQELERRLRFNLQHKGDFKRLHPVSRSKADVQDSLEAGLVILIDAPYSKEGNSAAEQTAQSILENHGSSPRIYRNTLAFLAADNNMLQDLHKALRTYLAWESILKDKETLNLAPYQQKQAQSQKEQADTNVEAQIQTVYQWVLVPNQKDPSSPWEWKVLRVSGDEKLAKRASSKVHQDKHMVLTLNASALRLEMDNIPLWRGDHVSIEQLVKDFGRYYYLPRLQSTEVLLEAIRAGLKMPTWEQDTFAYAESYDEEKGRYRGLRADYTSPVRITEGDTGLLVRPDVARRQIDAERPIIDPSPGPTIIDPSPGPTIIDSSPGPTIIDSSPGPTIINPPPPKPKLRRFHGSVTLDAARVGRDAGKIADEVITQFVGLGEKATVNVTLEIAVDIPDGAPDHVVRTVTENAKQLKFKQWGFEQE